MRILYTLLACLLGCLPTLSARHIIGGEMSYRFVEEISPGTYRYEILLIIYRDCDSGGGSLDNPAQMGIYQGNTMSAVLVDNFGVNRESIGPVDPVIPPCADASQVGNACVERGTYRFTVDLPLQSIDSYLIVYQRCCRTEDIVNIITPDDYGATYMVEITPASMALKNSSATFLEFPPTFICNNFQLNFDHSAVDSDGDSLAYSFCNPLHGGGSGGGGGGCETPVPSPPCAPPFELIPFTAAYNMLNPMGGNPVISVHPTTGMLTGTPNTLGQYVVGICVQEYRNGVLLSTVLRDFQFNVVDCTPTVFAQVQADSILGPKQYLVKRCGEKVITILNTTPQTNDLAAWEWEIDLGAGTPFNTTNWHATFAIPDFGTYYGRLYLNRNLNCEDTAFITIVAYPGSTAEFTWSWDSCTIGPVTFTNLATSESSGGLVSWDWGFSTSAIPPTTQLNPVIDFPDTGYYSVFLHVTDSDGCEDMKTVLVPWLPQPPPIIPPFPSQRICMPDEAYFAFPDSISLTGSIINWNFGDGNTLLSGGPNVVHTYETMGIYTVSVNITTPSNCETSATFNQLVSVFPKPQAAFGFNPKKVSNLNNRVQFNNLSDSSAALFNWQFNDADFSLEENPTFVFPDTGLQTVRLLVTNIHGCQDSVFATLDFVPEIQLYIPNAFAPHSTNGLGNDQFGVFGPVPGFTYYNLTVWSRWGEMVFEADSPEKYWDGRSLRNGDYMPVGVYVYLLEITDPRGRKYKYEGSVSLL